MSFALLTSLMFFNMALESALEPMNIVYDVIPDLLFLTILVDSPTAFVAGTL